MKKYIIFNNISNDELGTFRSLKDSKEFIFKHSKDTHSHVSDYVICEDDDKKGIFTNIYFVNSNGKIF